MDDDFRKFRDELLQDPETRAAYEARKPAYAFAVQLAELRRRGLSRAALGKLAGMTRSEVARIEAAEGCPTVETMARLLVAAGAGLDIYLTDDSGEVVHLPMALPGAPHRPRARRGTRDGETAPAAAPPG